MKKAMLILLMTLTLVLGMSMSVAAAPSPAGQKDTTDSDKDDTAPKTGQSDALIYAIATAAVLGGVVVVSAKQLREAR